MSIRLKTVVLALALLYGQLAVAGWIWRSYQQAYHPPPSATERCIAAHPGSDRASMIARTFCN